MEALRIFQWAKDVKIQLDVISYNAAISACQKGNRPENALMLFREMQQYQIEATATSFNAVMSSCGIQWQQALIMFDDMQSAEMELDVISFSAAISSCDIAGEWQRAWDLFHTMPQAKIQPNLIVFNALMSSCERYGQWQQAVCFLDMLCWCLIFMLVALLLKFWSVVSNLSYLTSYLGWSSLAEKNRGDSWTSALPVQLGFVMGMHDDGLTWFHQNQLRYWFPLVLA